MSYIAEDIFKTAEVFFRATRTIVTAFAYLDKDEPLQSEDSEYYAPIAVNSCFSLELYFKCISHMENQAYEAKHELVSLFSHISPSAQQSIKKAYVRYISGNENLRQTFAVDELAFDNVLKSANKAFVDFRYFFEKKHGDYVLISGIIKATRAYIISRQPNWKQLL